MLRFVVRRLLRGSWTVLLVLAGCFLLLEALPGDATGFVDDPSLSLQDRQRMAAVYGLDRPPAERLAGFFLHAVKGDLGVSISRHEPVARVIARALGPTLLLTLSALTIAFALGLTAGTRAVLRPRGVAAAITHRLLPLLDALPPFWLGLLGIWLLAGWLDWLPASHMHSAAGGGVVDLLRHLLLPSLVIGVPSAASVARHHASALERVWRGPATRSARAFGVTERRLLARALREAIQPALALAGLALPVLFGGAVVVEVVFSWPGLGRVQQQALLSGDVPLVLGGVLLVAVAVVLGGVLTDVAGSLADPRQSAGGESG